MNAVTFDSGTSRRRAIGIAQKLGCRVDYPNRTGEVRVTFPDGRRVRLSNRRKDAPRRLLCLLRQSFMTQAALT
jgi:hypothetical protein